jgi:hypothetical protein
LVFRNFFPKENGFSVEFVWWLCIKIANMYCGEKLPKWTQIMLWRSTS